MPRKSEAFFVCMIIIYGGAFNPPTKAHYLIAKMLIDKLVMDGFIEQKCSYKTIQEVDKETGIPKSINRKYFEYKVVSLDEIIEKMQ